MYISNKRFLFITIIALNSYLINDYHLILFAIYQMLRFWPNLNNIIHEIQNYNAHIYLREATFLYKI